MHGNVERFFKKMSIFLRNGTQFRKITVAVAIAKFSTAESIQQMKAYDER